MTDDDKFSYRLSFFLNSDEGKCLTDNANAYLYNAFFPFYEFTYACKVEKNVSCFTLDAKFMNKFGKPKTSFL